MDSASDSDSNCYGHGGGFAVDSSPSSDDVNVKKQFDTKPVKFRYLTIVENVRNSY